LERDDGKIDWQKMSADQIYNLYRGTYPWPGVWTLWEGKRLKLTETRKSNNSFTPGLVVELEKKVYVGAVEGSIELLKIQMEGKKEMDVKSFVNGYKIVGAQLA
jgi:methionyl-tRNA formyltransferase